MSRGSAPSSPSIAPNLTCGRRPDVVARDGLRGRNRRTLRTVKKSLSPDTAVAWWGLSREEVINGRADEPVAIAESDLMTLVLTPRFFIK